MSSGGAAGAWGWAGAGRAAGGGAGWAGLIRSAGLSRWAKVSCSAALRPQSSQAKTAAAARTAKARASQNLRPGAALSPARMPLRLRSSRRTASGLTQPKPFRDRSVRSPSMSASLQDGDCPGGKVRLRRERKASKWGRAPSCQSAGSGKENSQSSSQTRTPSWPAVTA